MCIDIATGSTERVAFSGNWVQIPINKEYAAILIRE